MAIIRVGGGGGGGRAAKPNFVKQSWGGGKGSGSKGGGQWLFVPDQSFSKGKGKGFSKGKGKGKGKDSKKIAWNRSMDKLNEVDAELKVWVGGLSEKVTWKTLEKHFEEICGIKPKISEVMRKGTGVCSFTSSEDAQTAIAAVNGSDLDGDSIECDVWAEKPKKEGAEDKPKRSFGGSKFEKRSTDSSVNINRIDAACKVWVGGLATKTNAAQLKKHFVDSGCEGAKMAKTLKPGTACVTFETEEQAASAIGVINGTELDGKAVEADVWTKSEKKEHGKKAKAEA